MLPETPLLQLVPARARTLLNRIGQQVWLTPQSLPVEWAGSSPEHVDFKTATRRPLRPVERPFFWGEPYDQAWFRITIPEPQRDGTWFLEWKEQGESTAYVDGVPYAGLDVAHHTCRIPKGTREIWMEVMCLESGIWMKIDRPAVTPEGCRFEGARARQRDPLAWEVYHDLDVLLMLLEDEYQRNNPALRTPFGRAIGYNTPLEDVTVLYRRLVRRIEEVLCAWETGGLAAARTALKSVYREFSGQAERLACRLTGHAHIDLVWLWTEKAAQFKAVHTFATANRLMEEYPEFRFGYSQPASYRAVGRRSPELLAQVRRRIRAGKWEALGAAEVESDTQIACGEALARSLLLGQEGFRELQGKPSPILWLPDVFGYTACLPQLLAQTEVKYFFTTKLHWGSVTLFPYSSFIWRGPDGAEILAHVSQGMGYNQNVTPAEVRGAARDYRQADVHGEFLMPSGFGDGGGGPTPEMCERARRMADLAGTPPTAWGRIDEFFAGLERVRHRLPVYRGELYLQYHRGVLTTHGDLKLAFRAAERSLQAWEAAHCAAGSGPIDIEAWRRMVFAQFHDYIPGSSVQDVYAEALPELRALAYRALDSAGRALAGRNGALSLFNPLPLPVRTTAQGRLVELAPLAGLPVEDLAAITHPPVTAGRNRLDNGRVSARFDKSGRITRLVVDGREVAAAAPMGELMLYPDHPHRFEAWDIDRSALALGEAVATPAACQVEAGELEARIVFTRKLGKESTIRTAYLLEAGSPVLKIEYDIDWREPERLLKVLFPTRHDGQLARFGAPFGSVLRSQQPGQPYDEAQWEVAGSRYAIVADDTECEGLFVVTEAKYGWSCRGGTLGLSLVRGAKMPGSPRKAILEQAGALTPYSDIKRHTVRIAVGRFRADAPRTELPAALAEILYAPVLPYEGPARACGYRGLAGGDSLVPCWAKPEPDGGWTLRLHETLGRRGQTRLLLEPGRSAAAVDLSGRPVAGVLRGDTVSFTPYQIVSLRMERAPAAAPRARRKGKR